MLCDNLKCVWGEGTNVYLWLTHAVWQKPTQHCKAIILQLKKKDYSRKLPKLMKDIMSLITELQNKEYNFLIK